MRNQQTPMTVDSTASASNAGTAPLYFPVSRSKLIALSICGLGIYQIYWFYKNWVLIKQRTRKDINPLGRALLAFFYCDELFEDVAHSARIRGMSVTFRPGLLWLAYVGLLLCWKLPNPLRLVTVLDFLPLLPVQKLIDEIDLRVAPRAERNDRFSGENIAVIILGGLTLIWVTVAPYILEQ